MKLIVFLIILSSCHHSSHYYENSSMQPEGEKRICFLGDTGKNPSEHRVVRSFLTKEKCDRIYILGDLIYRKNSRRDQKKILNENFAEIYGPISKSGHKPIVSIILGNHDYENDPDIWQTISKRMPFLFYPHKYFLEKYGDLCITSIDSNLWISSYKLISGMTQASWLLSMGDNMAECRMNIALTHHPYASAGHHQNANGLLEFYYHQLIIGKYDVLLSGHDHLVFDRGDHKGTKQLISGAGGGREEGFHLGFISMDVSFRDKKIFKVNYNLHQIISDEMKVISKPLPITPHPTNG
jgi:predicted phosphodiesterase